MPFFAPRLLADTARPRGWTLIPKQALKAGGATIYPDGTLRDLYNLPRGYWEAQDTADDLDAEMIKKKYPLSNTIFEDTRRAVLFQNRAEAGRFDLTNRWQLTKVDFLPRKPMPAMVGFPIMASLP